MPARLQVWLRRNVSAQATAARVQHVSVSRMQPFALRAAATEPAAVAARDGQRAKGSTATEAQSDGAGDAAAAASELASLRRSVAQGCLPLLDAAAQPPGGAALRSALAQLEVRLL